MTTPLVQRGEDFIVYDPETKRQTHTLPIVYASMMLQVARDYAGLPDVRTLTMSEIRFFFEGLRHELKEATKPRDTK